MALLVSTRSAIAQELGWFEGEPGWLRERRRRAWSAFESLPMPVWRRSKWWKTEMEGLDVEGISRGVDEEGRPEGETIGKGLAVQHNASPVRQRLKPHLARRGVIFTDLETAVRRYPELVREHLGSLEDLESSKLLALHAALWSGGVFIIYSIWCGDGSTSLGLLWDGYLRTGRICPFAHSFGGRGPLGLC